jgi:hypothetical protein
MACSMVRYFNRLFILNENVTFLNYFLFVAYLSFQCAKCHNLVEHDSNLLLLSDGNPICENCSYNCHVCKKPILNEAIMTG